MKRILSVQDLSCLGKCSLTVALPVISALGCQCAVLPTAVLSTHTAFPKPFVRDLTEDISPIRDHWKSIGAEFDVISIGYTIWTTDPQMNLIAFHGCKQDALAGERVYAVVCFFHVCGVVFGKLISKR